MRHKLAIMGLIYFTLMSGCGWFKNNDDGKQADNSKSPDPATTKPSTEPVPDPTIGRVAISIASF